jgi:hypothetical protein
MPTPIRTLALATPNRSTAPRPPQAETALLASCSSDATARLWWYDPTFEDNDEEWESGGGGAFK